MGHSKGSLEREGVHTDTVLPKKDRNISSKQPNTTSARTGGTKTMSRVSRRKEIIKITAEFSDTETKRKVQRINKSRSLFFEKIKLSTSL